MKINRSLVAFIIILIMHGLLFGKKKPHNNKGFKKSNSSGWTMQAAPSPSESYKVEVTGPSSVVWNKILVNGVKTGTQEDPDNWNVLKWIFNLPPAQGKSITLDFWGEDPKAHPKSEKTAETPKKQKLYISKTFPIVQKGLLPAPAVGAASYDAITPPNIVQEDVMSSWSVDNPADIFLKLDSFVDYTWKFPNSKGPANVLTGRVKVDTGLTLDGLIASLTASHVFLDAGIYDISLNLRFTEVIENGDSTTELPRNYSYSKKVVAVEHLPEYMGNVLSIITAPVIINEDVEYEYQFKTTFSFTRILPGNSLNIVDRYEGIEPGTIKYTIDWGDGMVTPELDYPGTGRTSIGTNPEPSVRDIALSNVTHKYLEPGTYIIKLKVIYFEKKYVDYPILSPGGQVIGYDFKVLGPYTHVATEIITVWDQTPPVIVGGKFPDLHATSGDPVEIRIEVSDNHPKESIQSAKIHYMIYTDRWKGVNAVEEWKTVDGILENLGGKSWSVTSKIHIPADFATKSFPENPDKDMKSLQYFVEVIDGSEIINPGDSDIADNHDFQNGYGKNGTDYGTITVTDNDPPDIMLVLDSKQDNRIFTFELNGGEGDFTTDPPIHGQVKKCWSSPENSECEMLNLTENPVSGQNPEVIVPARFVSDSYTLKEDTRINLVWKVIDAVDGPLELKSQQMALDKNNVVFTTSGTRTLDFYSFDKLNPDGTSNGRKLLIDFNIQKMLMYRKDLDNK